eukprot:UN23672
MNYRVAAVVAHSDVISAATEVETDINTKVNGQIIAVVVIVALLIIVIFYASYTIAHMIVEPVVELTNLCNEIADGNLNVEVDDTEATCTDVVNLRAAFKQMLTSVRFGSEAYYSGDVSRAKSCFEEALQLFTTVRNQRGIGISQNNLGSVYGQFGEFDKAHTAYMTAIELAEQSIENAGENEKDRLKAQKKLASRKGNRALLFVQQGDLVSAEKLVLEAIALDQKILNPIGFVIKSGTLSSIYIKQGRFKDADVSITQAEHLLFDENTFMTATEHNTEDFETVRQHAQLNRAELYYATGELQKAFDVIDKQLTSTKFLAFAVQSHAMQLLMKMYTQINATDALEAVSKILGSVSTSQKNIVFVYDF